MATEKEIKGIEVTVDSCKDLRGFNFLKKIVAHAVVWVGDRKKRQKTLRDRENNRNPEWKHRMWFDMDRQGCAVPRPGVNLEFEIHVDGVLSDKTIGKVHVPIASLVDAYTGVVTPAHYQLRGSNGEQTGLLNFYYRIEYHEVAGRSHAQSPHRSQPGCPCGREAQPTPDWPRPSIYPHLDIYQPPSAPELIHMMSGHQAPPADELIQSFQAHQAPAATSFGTHYQAPAATSFPVSTSFVSQAPEPYPPYPFHGTHYQAPPAPSLDHELPPSQLGPPQLTVPVLAQLLPASYLKTYRTGTTTTISSTTITTGLRDQTSFRYQDVGYPWGPVKGG